MTRDEKISLLDDMRVKHCYHETLSRQEFCTGVLMKPLDHAHRSVARYGGTIEDYMDIHEWLDQTKGAHPDMRHRAMLHNSMGPFIATEVFGRTIEIDGRPVDVRQICEDHIIEDLGRIPSLTAILSLIPEEHMGFFAHKRVRSRNYD